jgi:hypothetical protein
MGARRAEIATVFAGAALAVVVPAAILGALLERELLAPAVSRLAGDYVSVPLTTGAADIAIVAVGVAALAAVAAAWNSGRSLREPIAAGLREE